MILFNKIRFLLKQPTCYICVMHEVMVWKKIKYSLLTIVILVSSCVEEHYCSVETIDTDVQENTVSVHISASSSSDIIQYNWHFSDGYSKATLSPYVEYTLTESGNHTVEVEVEDAQGNLCYYESGFNVEENFLEDTCDVDFESLSIEGAAVDAAVEVTGESDGARFIWDTGDGYTLETESSEFYYQYANSGSYDFKVTYEYGECVDSTVRVVKLSEESFSDCEALVPFEAYVQIIDREVYFEPSTAIPNMDVKYYWDMGDGSAESYTYGPEFHHTYWGSGLYTIEVRMVLGECVVEESFEIEIN